AAARVLRSPPDRLASVRPVVKALTAGLTPLRRLERLRQLQHQLDRSRTLDALIERRERRVKMACPRCGVRLSLPEMVKHLWHTHRLFLDRGKVRDPRRLATELRADHTALNRAVLLAEDAELRAWAATSDPPAE